MKDNSWHCSLLSFGFLRIPFVEPPSHDVCEQQQARKYAGQQEGHERAIAGELTH
jgi:hypothetical protein